MSEQIEQLRERILALDEMEDLVETSTADDPTVQHIIDIPTLKQLVTRTSTWVRCSDRLPTNETKKYNVAMLNRKSGKVLYDLRRFIDGWFVGAEYGHIQIVAWQEIEPYQP